VDWRFKKFEMCLEERSVVCGEWNSLVGSELSSFQASPDLGKRFPPVFSSLPFGGNFFLRAMLFFFQPVAHGVFFFLAAPHKKKLFGGSVLSEF